MNRLYYVRAENENREGCAALVVSKNSREAETMWRAHFGRDVYGLDPLWIGHVPFLGRTGVVEWDAIRSQVKEVRELSAGAQLYYVRADDLMGENYDVFVEACDPAEIIDLWRQHWDGAADDLEPAWIGAIPISDNPGVIPWEAVRGEPELVESASDAPR